MLDTQLLYEARVMYSAAYDNSADTQRFRARVNFIIWTIIFPVSAHAWFSARLSFIRIYLDGE